MIGIYKIENLTNHKKYIGQSTNIEKRWKREREDSLNQNSKAYNYPLSRAFRKYGVDNFSFEVIEECSREQLNDREKYWVAHFNSFFSGYNQTLGGDSSVGGQPKENIIGVFNDLFTTDMFHKDIAEKWNISTEMVQGINTGRYWRMSNIDYPIQNRSKKLQKQKGLGRTQKFCSKCGKEISQKATLCIKCSNLNQRKVERPSRQELKNLIRTQSFLSIGEKYKVSDNAIRNWCKDYNLPYKVKDIKTYSDKEWELI